MNKHPYTNINLKGWILLGSGASVMCAGLILAINSTQNQYSQKTFHPRSLIVLPTNSWQGDLNQDGLYPDAYIITSKEIGDRKIPFYLYEKKREQIYVPAIKMKEFYPERETNYSEIERKLNEK